MPDFLKLASEYVGDLTDDRSIAFLEAMQTAAQAVDVSLLEEKISNLESENAALEARCDELRIKYRERFAEPISKEEPKEEPEEKSITIDDVLITN